MDDKKFELMIKKAFEIYVEIEYADEKLSDEEIDKMLREAVVEIKELYKKMEEDGNILADKSAERRQL